MAAVLTDESQESQCDSEDEYEQETQKPATTDDRIHLSLPRKGLFRESADVSTRLGISSRQQVALTAKLVKMGGGDLENVTLSVSSAWRHRTHAVQQREVEIIAAFQENMPPHVVLHWDGKVIVYEKDKTDDRLCIKVRMLDSKCMLPRLFN